MKQQTNKAKLRYSKWVGDYHRGRRWGWGKEVKELREKQADRKRETGIFLRFTHTHTHTHTNPAI